MTGSVPRAELVFTIEALCSHPVSIGRLAGGEGRMIPIIGGKVSGTMLNGEVVPGGADWSIVRENGLCTVDARYAIKADDGAIIQVFNGATERIVRSNPPAPILMITAPRFIAPDGPHDWLNRGVYVGTLMPDLSGKSAAVLIGVYRMV
jgi:Protein of unknown function (DUF3237)